MSHSGDGQFPGSAFLVPETASCSSVTSSETWNLEIVPLKSLFVSVSVFNGKLLSLEQNIFVQIGMICLCCLELSDTEMSSFFSVQREALIRWEVGPRLLDTS